MATTKFSDELKNTIDFCAHAFEPSEPEPEPLADGETAIADVGAHNAKGPIEDKALAGLDQDSKRVFKDVTAKGEMDNSSFEHIDNLVSDRFHGLALRLERGTLGLQQA